MIKYEKETGRKAIWRGIITEGYKKWKKGEKIYTREKERIALYVTEENKKKWQDFAEINDSMTMSKLIRIAVNFYIKFHQIIPNFHSFSKIFHDLKEPLTSIKGFAQLLIQNYKNKLDSDILFHLKEILEKSNYLEDMISEFLEIDNKQVVLYDLLIIDDDLSTLKVIETYFKFKGYSCKCINGGNNILQEVKQSKPKVVLLDIILPEHDGYEICKEIKNDEMTKDIPVYFITAIPTIEVEKKIRELGAEGYFQKPFDFNELEKIISLL